jgi:hypothetical protein
MSSKKSGNDGVWPAEELLNTSMRTPTVALALAGPFLLAAAR